MGKHIFLSKGFWVLGGLCIAAALVLAGSSAFAALKKDDLRSHFKIQIVMEKKVYALGEPIEGQVVIRTTAPSVLSGGFEVRLYQGGVLKSFKKIFINDLSLGATVFDFRKFGIPELPDEEGSLGTWRILIFQVGRRQNDAEVGFKVVPRGEGS